MKLSQERPPFTVPALVSDGGFLSVVPIDADPFHIGRATEHNLLLTEKDTSRVHAVIQRGPSAYELHDQGSTYGTFVNDQRIKSIELKHADRVRFGSLQRFVYFDRFDGVLFDSLETIIAYEPGPDTGRGPFVGDIGETINLPFVPPTRKSLPIPVTSSFRCTRKWTDLDATEVSTVKFCDVCEKNVHFIDNVDMARQAAEQHWCVALPAALFTVRQKS